MTVLPPIDRVLPRHLDDERLVAYLDGELPEGERSDASSHLEECWECRSRLSEIEASIDRFLKARRALLRTDVSPPAAALAEFRRRLTTHSEAMTLRRPLHRQLMTAARWLGQGIDLIAAGVRRPALGLAVVLAVVTISILAWWTTPLSATDVLARADVRESVVERVAPGVLTSVTQIEKVDARTGLAHPIGTLETARDNDSLAIQAIARWPGGGLQQEVFRDEEALGARGLFQSQVGQLFGQYLRSQPWVPAVTVAGYLQLVQDRGRDEAFARRLGAGMIELRHPFAPSHRSSIIEARLVLDAGSLAPRQISLFVLENGGRFEYRLRRLRLQLVPRSPDWVERFASARVETPSGRVRNVPRMFEPAPVRRPLPLSYADSIATAEEVSAAVALHAIAADLGEEVNVFQMSDGSLLVQGLVDTPARKTAIEESLSRVGGRLRVEIYTPSELTTGDELYDTPYGTSTPTVPSEVLPSPSVRIIDFSGVKFPLFEQLREHLAGRRAPSSPVGDDVVQRDIAAFVTEVVQRSEDALFHAWALRKLEIEFAAERTRSLPEVASAQVDELRVSHRRALADASRQVLQRIEDVSRVVAMTAGRSASLPTGDLDGSSLLRLASEQRDLVRNLLTPSVKPPDIGTTVARLTTVLRRLG